MVVVEENVKKGLEVNLIQQFSKIVQWKVLIIL